MGTLRKIGFVVALALGCALTGCCGMSVHEEEPATTEKQLEGLREAYEKGIISEKEYKHDERELLE